MMIFEVLGFLCGVVAISTAWGLLLRHDRDRVLDGFYNRRSLRSHPTRRA
jgi:hypothetical protein